jgi:carbamoyltransferase
MGAQQLMNILGLNYIFHDSSACLVSDGNLLVAIEEERLSGDKHSQKFPDRAIKRAMDYCNIRPKDIDHIAVSFNPRKYFLSKALYAATLGAGAGPFIAYEYVRIRARQKAFLDWYGKTWGAASTRPKVHLIDHHLAHVAGSYFVSPFDEAALLSMDGWGEWSTTWLGLAQGSTFKRLGESLFPHSLGCFYSAATEFCGFKPNYDEGKTMGLSPFGDAQRFYREVDALIHVGEDGEVRVDPTLFAYPRMTGTYCNPQFYRTFGAPRQQDAFDDHHCDVAAAFQRVTEEAILKLCRSLERRSTTRNLVLAGGVALNSVANGRILRETRFENIYVMPGAGDNGTCIGAAFYLHNGVLEKTNRYHHAQAYLGTDYSNQAIQKVLREAKVAYRMPQDVCSETAGLLRKGKIVGWFQGRMEFGPRALGGRSILADPTIPGMKDKLNAEVKHREPFRPFAPSVTMEDTGKYFEFSGQSPFMLMVCDVRPDQRAALPAITHVDGTARLQTVTREANERYYRLIREFGKISGVPVLLNTSFNVMGQPIVECPQQALQCFFTTGLDVLVMGDFVVEKASVQEQLAAASLASDERKHADASVN